jgi:hypothetical protein
MAGRKPGTPKTGGRQKGVANKITRDLKEMILGALDDAGGRKYLAQQADKNPAAFMTLVGKVLPMQVTGASGGPVETVTRIELVPVEPGERSPG